MLINVNGVQDFADYLQSWQFGARALTARAYDLLHGPDRAATWKVLSTTHDSTRRRFLPACSSQ